jgi:hypothetical protein
MFGLVHYMPPSHEFHAGNAPDNGEKWGSDLVWSWRFKHHSLQRPQLSDEWGWENNPMEVVKVCENLIPIKDKYSLGKRNFFYQCFNGHWNEESHEFRFGPHPKNWLWNVGGVRVTDDDGVRIVEQGEYKAPTTRESVQFSESEWREIFKGDAIDFLLDEHSPGTRQALREMQGSQFMRDLMDEDGPTRRTRSRARRLYNPHEDVVLGTNDNEAGPSNTANSPMNID